MAIIKIKFEHHENKVVYIQTQFGKVKIKQTSGNLFEDPSLTVVIQNKEDMTINPIKWSDDEENDKGLIVVPTKNLEKGN